MFGNTRPGLGRQAILWVVAAQVLLCGAALAQAQGVDSGKPSDNSFGSYMAREPMRRAAEAAVQRFVEAAAAGDMPELLKMAHPASIEATGRDEAERYLRQMVIPFFADHKEMGRSTTTTTAVAPNGKSGFAFYKYSVRENGEKKPFVVYALQEEGTWSVVNVLVDHFVPDRHRPNEQ